MKAEILTLIEKNAHLSLEDISKLLSIPQIKVATAVAEMEADKIICGYNTIINWDKFNEEKCNALIEVKVIPQRGTGFDSLANRIAKFDEVDSIFLISGGYDFMVQIKGKSMKEVSQFVFDKLSTLDNVQSTSTHFVLKKYKDHGIFLSQDKEDIRENILL